jgi:hypothetical protein
MTTQNWKTVSLEELATLPPGTAVRFCRVLWDDPVFLFEGSSIEMKDFLQEMADDMNEDYRKTAEKQYADTGVITQQSVASVKNQNKFLLFIAGPNGSTTSHTARIGSGRAPPRQQPDDENPLEIQVKTVKLVPHPKLENLVLVSATQDKDGEWIFTLKKKRGRKELFFSTRRDRIVGGKEWNHETHKQVWKDQAWSRGEALGVAERKEGGGTSRPSSGSIATSGALVPRFGSKVRWTNFIEDAQDRLEGVGVLQILT